MDHTFDYQSRALRAQEIMNQQGIDALLIGPGSNMFYLTGIHAMANERLYMMILPQSGTPCIVLPELEKLGASEHATYFDLVSWTDSEGYDDALRNALDTASKKIAVDNYLFSQYLIDVQQVLSGASFVKGSNVMRSLRLHKSPEEISIMKQAAANADKTLAELKQLQWSGRRERDIMVDAQRLLTENGQERLEFCIVGAGENGAKPHHHTGDRVIKPGDVIVFDFGGPYQGYHSDMTRTLLVDGGSVDPEYHRVHDVVNQARQAAHNAVKIGATCESVDAAARKVIADAGYGEYFVHRTGHGIGVDLHEDPYIREGNSETLEAGMAFSIEPGVYIPGRFGVRIEDIAIVTEQGSMNINMSPHGVELVA
jgi:Xaa-Pro aminopeptidase